MITILSYFSMEGERQMDQTRKLLADPFDKDPITAQAAADESQQMEGEKLAQELRKNGT
jgi:hypothetical protein